MVESALTTGEIPVRIIAKIYNDKVCVVAPAQKNEIKKSSIDIIKTSKLAEASAGNKNGIII